MDSIPEDDWFCSKCETEMILEKSKKQEDLETENSRGENSKIQEKEDISVPNQFILQHAKKVHKGQTKYKCNFCKKSFQRLGLLRYHTQKVHDQIHQEYEYKCDFCKTEYPTESALKNHFENVHNRLQDIDKCKICDKMFSESPALWRHMVNFHEGTHSCKSCTYSFKNNFLLEVHISKNHPEYYMEHEKEEEKYCDNCDNDMSLESKCKFCGCQICQGKFEPEKQLICESCECFFHIYCLNPPLDSIPDNDWFCSNCETKTVLENESSEESPKNQDKENILMKKSKNKEDEILVDNSKIKSDKLILKEHVDAIHGGKIIEQKFLNSRKVKHDKITVTEIIKNSNTKNCQKDSSHQDITDNTLIPKDEKQSTDKIMNLGVFESIKNTMAELGSNHLLLLRR